MRNSGLPQLKLSKETVRQFVLSSPNGQENHSFSGECGGYNTTLPGATCSTLDCTSYYSCQT